MMEMKRKWRSRGMVLLLALILSATPVAFAENRVEKKNYLSKIRTVDDSFLNGTTIDKEIIIQIGSPYGDAEMVEFYADGRSIGYAIFIEGVLVEFSENDSPFSSLEAGDEDVPFYDFTGCSVISAQEYEIVKQGQAEKKSIFFCKHKKLHCLSSGQ